MTGSGASEFTLTVPGTDVALRRDGDALLAEDGTGSPSVFPRLGHGIWDLTRPERRADLDRFAFDYAAVRAAESRDFTPDEVRRLPRLDADHPLAPMWRERARSYRVVADMLGDREPGAGLDIGAGCGWLAGNLARHGWRFAAIDVTVEGGDGLSLARHHQADLVLARAEMEALPFASSSVDLAVFNASLHYACDVGDALHEARRVLRPGGTLVVLDSPVYIDPIAGRQSVAEFAEHVKKVHCLDVAPLAGAGFISEADLSAFEHEAGQRWQRREPAGQLRSGLRRWRGRRRAGRETAARPVLIMHDGGNR